MDFVVQTLSVMVAWTVCWLVVILIISATQAFSYDLSWDEVVEQLDYEIQARSREGMQAPTVESLAAVERLRRGCQSESEPELRPAWRANPSGRRGSASGSGQGLRIAD